MMVSTRCPERVLRVHLPARRRPAGADLPMPALPHEAADRPGGRRGLGLDRDHQAVASHRRRSRGGELQPAPAGGRGRGNLAGGGAALGVGVPPGSESGEWPIGDFDLLSEFEYSPAYEPGAGFDESGEMCAEPFSQSASRVSGSSSASRPRTASGSVSAPSDPGAIGSDEGGQVGRFRVLGVLGEGSTPSSTAPSTRSSIGRWP